MTARRRGTDPQAPARTCAAAGAPARAFVVLMFAITIAKMAINQ